MERILSKWLVIAVIILSAIGLIISAYLGVNHYTIGSLDYNLTEYITIFGLPTALIAIPYFFIFLMCGLLYLDTKKSTIRRIFPSLGILGLAGAIWISYIQFFQVKIFCELHTALSVIMVALFALALITLKKKKES